ncbi:MAG: DUF134 domain-containing protein [Firmicutes bacterium]|nr:DUF134 domain-containing protein [Bacillota bacterium]
MPRPQKPRLICQLPDHKNYGPYNHSGLEIKTIVLLLDELETIRLIDFEGCNQEEAANQMNVARTTIQRIYGEARKKIADSLINGKQIIIEGGEYILCNKNCEKCSKSKRFRKIND